MTSGEELMVFLEMNGYNITKYKLKKQLSQVKRGQISLMNKNSLQEFLLEYYNSEDVSILHTNPLIYLELWNKQKIEKEKVNIFDFFIEHPRIESVMTLQSFIDDATIKEEIKRRILNEIINKWVRDYKEYTKAIVDNTNEWADAMMKDVEYYRIPTMYKTIGIALVFIILFLSYFSNLSFFKIYHQAIVQTQWFNVYFIIVFVLAAVYVIRTDLFRKKVKNVKVTWKKHIVKQENKIDKQLDKFAFEFENLIENDELISRRKVLKNFTLVESINTKIKALKKHIFNYEKSFNNVLCKYESRLHSKDVSFFTIFFIFVIYLMLGFVLSKGWM